MNHESLARRASKGALSMILLALVTTSLGVASEPTPSQTFQASVCRITNQHQGTADLGSGTLIDKTADGGEGLVLTCAHLFRDGVGTVLVRFADGQTHRAKLIAVDHQADLAALAIASPTGSPAAVAPEQNTAGQFHACGYGPHGVYRCAVGPSAGEAVSEGQVSLLIADAVRPGDSGGGVFDEQGQLVAVIWGTVEGVTYASHGQPLRRFLGRVLGRRSGVVYSCPNGVCPRQPTQPPPQKIPRRNPVVIDPRIDELQQQLKASRSEANMRHAALLEKLKTLSGPTAGEAAGTTAINLLGLSGPAGWALLASTAVLGCLLGNYLRTKSKKNKRSSPPTTSPEAPADDADITFRDERQAIWHHETRQPIERDDAEARQLLRLSQLEGRDPLQDAVAGRLALDRLDALADRESDNNADPQHARWADELRRELRERFNDIAPTKFEAN